MVTDSTAVSASLPAVTARSLILLVVTDSTAATGLPMASLVAATKSTSLAAVTAPPASLALLTAPSTILPPVTASAASLSAVTALVAMWSVVTAPLVRVVLPPPPPPVPSTAFRSSCSMSRVITPSRITRASLPS